MKRRYALFPVILAVSLLIGIQAVEVVDANPFGLAKQINTPSDAEPPIVSINSPQNYTNYSGTFNISFSVKVPQYYSKSAIVDIYYTIDNETDAIPHQYWTLMQGPGISQYSTSIIAPTLPAGNHSLKIRAQGGSYDFYNFFLIDGYSQVYFVTTNNPSTNPTSNSNPAPSPTQIISPTPSPNPSQSMPTINTGPTLPVELNPSIVYIILAIVIVIVAAASISLVYFKKHKPKSELDKKS